MSTLTITINMDAKCQYAAARIEELEAVVEAAKELDEILQCDDARKEIDSFTGQPLREALAALEEKE